MEGLSKGYSKAHVDDLKADEAANAIYHIQHRQKPKVYDPRADMLTSQQVADLTGLPLKKVQKLAKKGEIPSTFYKGHRRYKLADLAHWMDVQRFTDHR